MQTSHTTWLLGNDLRGPIPFGIGKKHDLAQLRNSAGFGGSHTKENGFFPCRATSASSSPSPPSPYQRKFRGKTGPRRQFVLHNLAKVKSQGTVPQILPNKKSYRIRRYRTPHANVIIGSRIDDHGGHDGRMKRKQVKRSEEPLLTTG
jgi:hypothetical protein